IVAPAASQERIARATWTDIAREPWIMTPPISTHSQLAAALFNEHNITPTKVVEADDEVVVSSLVLAGLGMALMREDLALEKASAGEVCLWTDVQLTTRLQFVFRRDREQDPILRALVDTLDDVWKLGVGGARRTGSAARRPEHAASLT